MQKDINAISAAVTTMAAAGTKLYKGAARETFTGEGSSLTQGTYNPVRHTADGTIAVAVPRRNGADYEALCFTNAAGQEIKVSTGSLFNRVRVVDSVAAASLQPNQTWLGETAQPTREAFRYGDDVAKCERATVTIGDADYAIYAVPAFSLTVERVYVVPRFEPGNNTPIFDEKCKLRKAWFAA